MSRRIGSNFSDEQRLSNDFIHFRSRMFLFHFDSCLSSSCDDTEPVRGALWKSASVKTRPFHRNKETKVNAFDHSDISEWNEEEIERWQFGQIASKIEHDKPLIVISMWTLRESSVYDDGRIWMNMRLVWEERGKRKLTQRGIFQYVQIWRINPVYQKNSGLIFVVLALRCES